MQCDVEHRNICMFLIVFLSFVSLWLSYHDEADGGRLGSILPLHNYDFGLCHNYALEFISL